MKSEIFGKIQALEAGKNRFVFVLSSDVLKEMIKKGVVFSAHFYNWKKREGHQRNSADYVSRIEEIAQYLLGGHQIDPSLTFNVANPPHFANDMLSLPMEFGMVMGRHRLGGALRAIEIADKEGKECPPFVLVVVLTCRTPEENQLMFAVDGATQKRIPAALLKWEQAHIIERMTLEERKHLPKCLRKGFRCLSHARDAVELLMTKNAGKLKDNPFYGKISMPNPDPRDKCIAMAINILEPVRVALAKKTSAYVHRVEDVAVTFANFFRAWIELIPAALDSESDLNLLKPHAGSECLCFLLDHIMKFKSFRHRVPTTEEFKSFLRKHAGRYTKATTWDSSNMVSVAANLHGKATASKLARTIYQEIKESCGEDDDMQEVELEDAGVLVL